VLTRLNPWVVGLHFLVSMALVVLATLLVNRAYGRTGKAGTVQLTRRAGGRTPGDDCRRVFLSGRRHAWALWLPEPVPMPVTATRPGMISIGTSSRTSTPCPPTWSPPARCSDCSFVVPRRIPGPFRSAVFMLLGVTVLQAVIGFTQYYTGIPALLVGAHMLAAALLMSAATTPRTWPATAPSGSRVRHVVASGK
jgi:cytochrome c oxidase assembly protein subunit 15